MMLIKQDFWPIRPRSLHGAWLQALLVSSLRLGLDDAIVKFAVGLRLDTTICAVHRCRNCSEKVDCCGRYDLSCYVVIVREYITVSMELLPPYITYRAFNSGKIPSPLEPVNLSKSIGEGPDGMLFF